MNECLFKFPYGAVLCFNSVDESRDIKRPRVHLTKELEGYKNGVTPRDVTSLASTSRLSFLLLFSPRNCGIKVSVFIHQGNTVKFRLRRRPLILKTNIWNLRTERNNRDVVTSAKSIIRHLIQPSRGLRAQIPNIMRCDKRCSCFCRITHLLPQARVWGNEVKLTLSSIKK